MFIFLSLYQEERTDCSHSAVKWASPNIHDLKNILEKVEIHKILHTVCDKRLSAVDKLPMTQLRDECVKLQLNAKGKKCELVDRLKNCLGHDAKVICQCNVIVTFECTYLFIIF